MAFKIVHTIPDAHSMSILCVAFDDTRNELYTGGKDCLIKVWDSESGKLLRSQEQHSNWVMDLLFVPAPVKMLFSCGLDGNILVWSDRGRLLQVIEYGGPTFCMGWDSKKRQLLVGGRGAVQAYVVLRSSANYIQTDSERKAVGYLKFLELSFCLCHHDDVLMSVCCSDKGKVFTVGMDRALCIFDSDRPNDTLKIIPNCHEGGITTVTFDKDGKWLVTGAYDGTVKIWSQEGHCLDSFDNITDCVTSIAYVPATKSYWVSGKANSVVVIDPLAAANMTEWVADTSEFHNLILSKVLHSHKKDLVIGLSVERKVVIWKYDKCAPHRVLHGHTNWVDVVIVANRRAYKERLLMKDMTDVLPERTKFRAAVNQTRKSYNSQQQQMIPGGVSGGDKQPRPSDSVLPSNNSSDTTSNNVHGEDHQKNTKLSRSTTSGNTYRESALQSSLTSTRTSASTQSNTHGHEVSEKNSRGDTRNINGAGVGAAKEGSQQDPGRSTSDHEEELLPPMEITFEPEVFSGSADGSIHKWLTNPDPNKDIWVRRNLAPKTSKAIICMLHHPDLDVLIVGSEDAQINIWNIDGNRSVPLWRSAVRQAGGPDILKGHTDKVVGLCALPELVLVSASADRSLRFWDMSTRLLTDVYEFAQDHPFQDMTYSPTRGEFATCGGDTHFKIWGGEKRKRVRARPEGASGDIVMVRWCTSHDGRWITASEQGAVCIWDPITKAKIHMLCLLKQPITTLFVDEDNDFILLSYIYDHTIRVHPLSTLGDEVCSYKGHTNQVHSIVYLKERHQYISASWDTTLRVWLAPPKDKLQVETKRLDLQTMMIRQQDGPGEAPSDDFDLAEEMKQYVSNYEKAHPIIMPKVLAEPMNVNILFLQPSNNQKILPMASDAKVTVHPDPHDHSQHQTIDHVTDHDPPADLCSKLDELEIIFSRRISPRYPDRQPSKFTVPTVLLPASPQPHNFEV